MTKGSVKLFHFFMILCCKTQIVSLLYRDLKEHKAARMAESDRCAVTASGFSLLSSRRVRRVQLTQMFITLEAWYLTPW